MNGTASRTLTYAAFTDAFLLMTTLSVIGIGLSWFLKDRVLIEHHARSRMPAEPVAASEGLLQLTIPVAPIAGVVQAQPAGDASEAKVTPAGKVSDKVAEAAAFGPALATVIV